MNFDICEKFCVHLLDIWYKWDNWFNVGGHWLETVKFKSAWIF